MWITLFGIACIRHYPVGHIIWDNFIQYKDFIHVCYEPPTNKFWDIEIKIRVCDALKWLTKTKYNNYIFLSVTIWVKFIRFTFSFYQIEIKIFFNFLTGLFYTVFNLFHSIFVQFSQYNYFEWLSVENFFASVTFNKQIKSKDKRSKNQCLLFFLFSWGKSETRHSCHRKISRIYIQWHDIFPINRMCWENVNAFQLSLKYTFWILEVMSGNNTWEC